MNPCNGIPGAPVSTRILSPLRCRLTASPAQLFLELARVAQTTHEIAHKYVELRQQIEEAMRGYARCDKDRVADLAGAVGRQAAAADALHAFLIALLAIILAILAGWLGGPRVHWAAAKSSEHRRDWSWRSSASYCAAFDATPA